MGLLGKDSKRVLVMGDTHCGHAVGLTPPNHDPGYTNGGQAKLTRVRKIMWDWYSSTIDNLGKIDIVVMNGDAIDGKGKKSGSTEQIAPDRQTQTEMAMDVLMRTGATQHYMTYGTPYHVGTGEDWERNIARELGCSIHDELNLDINGTMFNFKHHVGSSSVPYGRATQISKERLWNLLWSVKADMPKADVLVRSHVHYFQHAGGNGWLSMVLPALQAPYSKYGMRRMSGTVDFGFVVFDVEKDGTYTWTPHLTNGVVVADIQKA